MLQTAVTLINYVQKKKKKKKIIEERMFPSVTRFRNNRCIPVHLLAPVVLVVPVPASDRQNWNNLDYRENRYNWSRGVDRHNREGPYVLQSASTRHHRFKIPKSGISEVFFKYGSEFSNLKPSIKRRNNGYI